jgi:hypothetical protein
MLYEVSPSQHVQELGTAADGQDGSAGFNECTEYSQLSVVPAGPDISHARMGGRAIAFCGNVCSTGDQEPIQVRDQVSLTAWPEGDQNGASSGGGHHVGVIRGQEINVGVHTGPLRTFAFCCYAD